MPTSYTPSVRALRKRRMREERVREGLCAGCGDEAMPGMTLCGFCDEAKEERLALLAEKKKSGCRRCGKPPVPGRKFCQCHLDYMRVSNPKRVRRPQTNGD